MIPYSDLTPEQRAEVQRTFADDLFGTDARAYAYRFDGGQLTRHRLHPASPAKRKAGRASQRPDITGHYHGPEQITMPGWLVNQIARSTLEEQTHEIPEPAAHTGGPVAAGDLHHTRADRLGARTLLPQQIPNEKVLTP